MPNNIKLIPCESFTLKTYLSKDEIISRLNSKIDYNKKLSYIPNKNTYKEYEGYTTTNGFVIRRIWKNLRNSFIPLIIGEFGNKSHQIDIKIRPAKFVIIFSVFISVFGLFMFFMSSDFSPKDPYIYDELIEIIGEEKFNDLDIDKNVVYKEVSIDWGSLIFPLVTYLMLMFSFNYDIKNIREDIIKLLEADIMNDY